MERNWLWQLLIQLKSEKSELLSKLEIWIHFSMDPIYYRVMWLHLNETNAFVIRFLGGDLLTFVTMSIRRCVYIRISENEFFVQKSIHYKAKTPMSSNHLSCLNRTSELFKWIISLHFIKKYWSFSASWMCAFGVLLQNLNCDKVLCTARASLYP